MPGREKEKGSNHHGCVHAFERVCPVGDGRIEESDLAESSGARRIDPGGRGGHIHRHDLSLRGGPDLPVPPRTVHAVKMMSKHWFAIHTYSGHENKVKNNLERAIKNAGMEENFGRIIVAMEDHAEMKDGQRVVSRRKTFPSYVLLEMDLSSETQALVAAVPGVTRFVGTGQDPLPLQEIEVDRILGRLDKTKPREPM